MDDVAAATEIPRPEITANVVPTEFGPRSLETRQIQEKGVTDVAASPSGLSSQRMAIGSVAAIADVSPQQSNMVGGFVSRTSSSDGGARSPVLAALPVGRRCLKPRGSRQPRSSKRVVWDEKAIAEHDKERGTRQKIDEPDTPFVRSPQKESDSEGGPSSSDDEQHRLSFRQNLVVPGLVTESAPPKPMFQESPSVEEKSGDVCISAATRLDLWMRSGGNRRDCTSSAAVGSCDNDHIADEETSGPGSGCSSRSSSSAKHPIEKNLSNAGSGYQRIVREEKRISLSEEMPAPKPTSDSFKAKRAQHYNEVAALKAYQPHDDEDSSTESETSGEGESTDAATMTNTNTNINLTMPKDHLDKGHRRVKSGSNTDACASNLLAATLSDEHELGGAREDGAAFSSVIGDGCRQSNETTPTKLRTVDVDSSNSRTVANPLEAGTSAQFERGQDLETVVAGDDTQPPEDLRRQNFDRVAFSAGETTKLTGASGSADWKAKRNAHYSEMAAALRAMPPPSDDEEEDTDDEEGT
eukprot:TRINITY_DN50250_c0_g1_i1.p1 TRINITY_DN50250_c0_g1~~TRINITY_DN50250_c0_g1_i1.p1  ORF type:complete len:545 (-),score=99.16 TRINITY_DN50250_c0_g1_i1:88-1665(-)